MNDFKKAENIVQLMKELRYLPNSWEVISVELMENDDINIVFNYDDCEDYENVVVPQKIWELDSYEVYKAWINLLIESDREQSITNYRFDGKTEYVPIKQIKVKALKYTGKNYKEVEDFCGKHAFISLLSAYIFIDDSWKLLCYDDIIVKYPFDSGFSVMTENQFKEMFKYE
ncbi:MAG: hypothetical protein J1F35_06520 [Erysipelotrichales bacterium]|nr:hypothetical protein [Erysipelotrichales bacterium]